MRWPAFFLGVVLVSAAGCRAATITYTLKDNGVRCIRGPCQNISVLTPTDAQSQTVSDVDFSRLQLGDHDVLKLVEKLHGPEGLRAQGFIEDGPDPDARTFHVTRAL
jgi:hypothetical protein